MITDHKYQEHTIPSLIEMDRFYIEHFSECVNAELYVSKFLLKENSKYQTEPCVNAEYLFQGKTLSLEYLSILLLSIFLCGIAVNTCNDPNLTL